MLRKLLRYIFVLALVLTIVGCGKNEKVVKEEVTDISKQIEIKEAKNSDAEMGLVSPVLDHASDKTIVFHDYFGLFVYSLEHDQIVKSINIKDLGFKYVQGDDALFVSFDEAKGILTLSTMTKESSPN